MPHPSGGLYGHPEQPKGGGEWRKVAELSQNLILNYFYEVKYFKIWIFFKNPLLKFNKTLLVRYCPHDWVLKIFFYYLIGLLEHCAIETSLAREK